jgi:hypothetical protein
MNAPTELVVTVTKGSASPEEMTALALVLVARDMESDPPRRAAARWRAPAYRMAHSWRTAP